MTPSSTPNGAGAGSVLPDGIVARERIPQAHKVALSEIPAGAPVTRYGQTIGIANRTIPAGSWVREELLDLPRGLMVFAPPHIQIDQAQGG